MAPDRVVERNAAAFADRQQQRFRLRRQAIPVQKLWPVAAEAQAQIAVLQPGANLDRALRPAPAGALWRRSEIRYRLRGLRQIDRHSAGGNAQRGGIEFELRVALLQQQGIGGKADEQRERERRKPVFHRGVLER